MPFNEAALLRAKECILADPTQFDMSDWQNIDSKSSCGTTACIAGWLVFNERPHIRSSDGNLSLCTDFAMEAEKIIGAENCFPNDLFAETNWPRELFFEFNKAKNKTQKAKIAAKAIDDFIQKEKLYTEIKKIYPKVRIEFNDE
ncbi:hypothetical protein UFOVP434_102 [uncultured Caudovirales phage]|uniref:Uncharacterized protein n=1 Tax=uncultured Caudovirales phage TaxID=2100421 RepID=A0A6J5M8A4_9CAUD|nr:hypothetical protein UFOVP434_102 [uncultured Caudovirales phage]